LIDEAQSDGKITNYWRASKAGKMFWQGAGKHNKNKRSYSIILLINNEYEKLTKEEASSDQN
jgi:hypothetical protein